MSFLSRIMKCLGIVKQKKILIITANFSGGGLEKRINNIVNLFHGKYHFSLISKTPFENMKIKPSIYFQKIYSWNEHFQALKNIDLIDVHPFGVENLLKEWNIPPKVKKIYTLHGEASILEDLNFLSEYDHVYSVSQFLIPKVIEQYPALKNKISLSKNYDDFHFITLTKQTSDNDILLSITNIANPAYLQKIINIIPEKYVIHLIGNITDKLISREHGKLISHGFVNIPQFLEKNSFCAAIARGGFAAMDIISQNIPLICISDNLDGYYLDVLTKDNFPFLSDCNFVTRKPFDANFLCTQIEKISKNTDNYCCQQLLYQNNFLSDMNDIYRF